jgi:glutamate synthase (NADPH/NADH) small chain
MGDPKGFIKIKRKEAGYRPVEERIKDFSEVEQVLNEEDRLLQASRCMDCGVPFCHWACPTDSRIPEWQDALYRKDFQSAIRLLQYTNDLPEITGRICPALCEKSCVLNIYEEPVTIRENEVALAEKAFKLGLIQPKPPKKRTGKKVAVIGSGPAGLTLASRLNRLGHKVTVFEKDEEPGGLLRFGIPDFKLNKSVIDRRINLYKEEGIRFKTKTQVGHDYPVEKLMQEFDAVCVAIGAGQPRDIQVPGREAQGVYFALEFLTQQNRVVAGKHISKKDRISAKNKEVIVIGGGDTGSDCVGTSIRQGAKSVKQIEILPMPPKKRSEDNPWPYWPNVLRTSSSHEEGVERIWSTATVRFITEDGKVTGIETVKVEWEQDANGKYQMKELPDTKQILKADLVLLALGFTQPVHEGLLNSLGVEYDDRGNVKTRNGATSKTGVFAVGDASTGASLVVKAIKSAQESVEAVHYFLMKKEA